jgi:hypothetical protein
MKALAEGKSILAENFFCKLMLSQPQSADGYKGMAEVCMLDGRTNGALLLMEHALELVRESCIADESDIEVYEMFDDDLQRMKKTIADLKKNKT